MVVWLKIVVSVLIVGIRSSLVGQDKKSRSA